MYNGKASDSTMSLIFTYNIMCEGEGLPLLQDAVFISSYSSFSVLAASNTSSSFCHLNMRLACDGSSTGN